MISFLAFGKVFTAFMTGNIVFLGLGAVSSVGPDVGRVAVSLVAFAAGVLITARIVRPVQDKGFVWPRRVSIALSVVAVAQAGFLIGWIVTFGHPPTAVGDILVALSAFAMGTQMDAIRSLHVPETSTTAATATLVSFVNDIADWSHSSAEGRIGLQPRIMVAMAVGAAVGALLLVHARLYVSVLPLITTLIVIVIASVALKPKPPR
jgi:uncharacterized membrane protein YoaK (UPF0700 family)